MIVVGLDVNTKGYHAAMISSVSNRDEPVLLTQSQHDWKRLGLWSAALHEVAVDLLRLTASAVEECQGQPPYFFVEEPVVAGKRNLRTAILISQMTGVIVAGCTMYSPRVYLVPVSTWKSYTVGKGNASKDEVKGWLTALHPSYAAQCAGRQDLIDACCIAWHGVHIADSAGRILVESAES